MGTKTEMNRQIWSILSTIPFYVTLVVLSLKPNLLVPIVTFNSWTAQLYLLSLWAWLAIIWFFIATILNSTHQHWQRLTFVNASLVVVPLYFLWLSFSA